MNSTRLKHHAALMYAHACTAQLTLLDSFQSTSVHLSHNTAYLVLHCYLLSIYVFSSLLSVCLNQWLHLQAHEFFSDAEEAAEDAADAVKDEANRATSSRPHMARPLGKDPIPTNTEDIAKWRKAHPPPARPTREAGSDKRQSAEGSWESAKGQTREAVDEAKGKSREAADDLKGKYKETAEDVKSEIKATAEDVKDKASESVDGWASWFGEFPQQYFCCTHFHKLCVLPTMRRHIATQWHAWVPLCVTAVPCKTGRQQV